MKQFDENDDDHDTDNGNTNDDDDNDDSDDDDDAICSYIHNAVFSIHAQTSFAHSFLCCYNRNNETFFWAQTHT